LRGSLLLGLKERERTGKRERVIWEMAEVSGVWCVGKDSVVVVRFFLASQNGNKSLSKNRKSFLIKPHFWILGVHQFSGDLDLVCGVGWGSKIHPTTHTVDTRTSDGGSITRSGICISPSSSTGSLGGQIISEAILLSPVSSPRPKYLFSPIRTRFPLYKLQTKKTNYAFTSQKSKKITKRPG